MSISTKFSFLGIIVYVCALTTNKQICIPYDRVCTLLPKFILIDNETIADRAVTALHS